MWGGSLLFTRIMQSWPSPVQHACQKCHLLNLPAWLPSTQPAWQNEKKTTSHQEMEAELCCPSSWSSQVPWVGNAHNTLPNSFTMLFPFECALGYQPPWFETWRKLQCRQCRFRCTTAEQLVAPVTCLIQTNCHRTPSPKYATSDQVKSKPWSTHVSLGWNCPPLSGSIPPFMSPNW